MKLEQVTGPIQQMICIRGFVGEWADLARAGKPIPLPPRGMSWWAGIMGNTNFDKIFDKVSDDVLWYAGYNVDTDAFRTDCTPGVIISAVCRYRQVGQYIQFLGGWGIGMENEPLPGKHSNYKNIGEWEADLTAKGARYFGREFFTPIIPLDNTGNMDLEHTEGFVCITPCTYYKLEKDLLG